MDLCINKVMGHLKTCGGREQGIHFGSVLLKRAELFEAWEMLC